MKNLVSRSAVLGLSLVASGVALATEPTAIDVSDAVATIEGGMNAVQAIGAAALVIVAAIAIFKMVRRAP